MYADWLVAAAGVDYYYLWVFVASSAAGVDYVVRVCGLLLHGRDYFSF